MLTLLMCAAAALVRMLAPLPACLPACRYVGESPLAGSAEHIDTRERLVGTTPPGPKCPTGMRGAEGACTAVGSSTAATGTSLSLRIRHRGRKHRTDRCGGSSSSSSSSSWSSNSSSGDEREIDQQYSRGGSRGYSRQTGGGMGAHALPAGGGAGVVGGQVVSVLREDMSETVCDRKEFTQVCVEGVYRIFRGGAVAACCTVLRGSTKRLQVVMCARFETTLLLPPRCLCVVAQGKPSPRPTTCAAATQVSFPLHTSFYAAAAAAGMTAVRRLRTVQ